MVELMRNESWAALIHETAVVVIMNIVLRIVFKIDPISYGEVYMTTAGAISAAWVLILVVTAWRFELMKRD